MAKKALNYCLPFASKVIRAWAISSQVPQPNRSHFPRRLTPLTPVNAIQEREIRFTTDKDTLERKELGEEEVEELGG